MATVGGDLEDRAGPGLSPRRVLAVIAAALLFAVLLNASELEREARQKPFGAERDFWVAVWKPFAFVSRTLYLDKPREWADEALDRNASHAVFELPPDASSQTPPAGQTQQGVRLRTPTVEEPLRLWVGGDSVVKIVGEAVLRLADESGLFDATHESQLESGLTRPDFFDWPRELDKVAKRDPVYEVIVVMFGANDGQGIVESDGTVHQEAGTPGWQAEYRRRVAGVMDLLRGDGRLVVWVGQPVMRDGGFNDRIEMMNAIFESEAKERPWVKYIDLRPLFADKDGDYDAYIEDDDGEVKLMRHPDGVHFVREGGERAARHILEEILEQAGAE